MCEKIRGSVAGGSTARSPAMTTLRIQLVSSKNRRAAAVGYLQTNMGHQFGSQAPIIARQQSNTAGTTSTERHGGHHPGGEIAGQDRGQIGQTDG